MCEIRYSKNKTKYTGMLRQNFEILRRFDGVNLANYPITSSFLAVLIVAA